MTSSPAAVARVLDQLWEALGDGIASKGVIELIVKQALDAIQRETWEAAVEVIREEDFTTCPGAKRAVSRMLTLGGKPPNTAAGKAASLEERDAR